MKRLKKSLRNLNPIYVLKLDTTLLGMSIKKKLSSRDFYDLVAPIYLPIDIFLNRYKSALIEKIQALIKGELLCIGIGFGKELNLYKKHQVTGIDHSKKMVSKAKKFNRGNHVNIELMNGEDTAFPNESFDYIVISHVLSVTDNPKKLIQESGRLLKKGGRIFILNHFTPNNPLKYIDKAFNSLSSLLCFRSNFYLNDIPETPDLKIVESSSVGKLGYYMMVQMKKTHV